MSRYLAKLSSVVLVLCFGAAAPVGAEKEGQAAKKARPTRARVPVASRPVYLDQEHAPKGAGWIPLFNGKDLTGWKSFPEDRPNSWRVEDGILVSAFKPGEHGRNIYTDRKFEDCEIYYEYQVPEDGNSGVFLRGQYEIQIKDDFGAPADKPQDWGNGGIYGQKAPLKNVSKRAGEWQSGYARIVGKEITVYINGEKVIDKWTLPKATHLYGELKVKDGDPTGPIMLQGDHKPIKFRHVMLRPIRKGIAG